MSKVDNTGNLDVQGLLTCGSFVPPAGCITDASISSIAAVARSKLAQDNLKPYAIPLTHMRVWDALHTVLPAAGANDDLGISGGTLGTNPVYLSTGDLKAAGATTRYTRFCVPLPAEYVDGETVTLRITGGMQTTVADNAATVDVQAYENTGASATGVSADLCATAAQSINSLTAAAKDFTITPTDLVAGDMLDIRIAVAVNDAATATDVIANIYKVELLCDVKG